MISVQSMTKNEMELLPRYYNFIKKFADEWVILDACSTDGTVEFIEKVQKYDKKLKVTFISDKKYDLKNCKDFNLLLQESLELCTGDWVWLGYIDEFVPVLPMVINKLITENVNYIFDRFNISSIRPLKYSSAEEVMRLYPKSGSKWIGNKIHNENLSNNCTNRKVNEAKIFHIGEARNLEHLIEKEAGFESCGSTVLSSKFTEDDRVKLQRNDLHTDQLGEILYVNDALPIVNPYKLLNVDRINLLKHDMLINPMMIEFFPSGVCNHKCKWCLFESCRDAKFLSYETISKVLEETEGKVKSIELCGGGEPTLHPRFLDIIEEAYIRGFKVGLITNGSMLSKYYREIARYCSYVRVSLDAVDKSVHNAIHGTKDFEEIVIGIRGILQEKSDYNYPIQVGTKFTLGSLNMYDVLDMVRFSVFLGVNNVQFKAVTESEYMIPVEKLRDIQDLIDNAKKIKSNFVIGGVMPTRLNYVCKANLLSTFINEVGDMYICCYYKGREQEHKFGNIMSKSFFDIWYSKEHMEALTKIDFSKCNNFCCRFHKYNDVLNEYFNQGEVVFI